LLTLIILDIENHRHYNELDGSNGEESDSRQSILRKIWSWLVKIKYSI